MAPSFPHVVAVLTAVAVCEIPAVANRVGVTLSEDNSQAIWRLQSSVNRCGANSAYLMLRLSGLDVEYNDVMHSVMPSQRGNSLTEVRMAVAKHGLPCTVIRGTPAQLHSVRLPAIAHFEEELGVSGHFVVVTAVTETTVYCVDGSSAARLSMLIPDFQRYWSGYLIVASGRDMLLYFLQVLGALGMGFFVVVSFGRRITQEFASVRSRVKRYWHQLSPRRAGVNGSGSQLPLDAQAAEHLQPLN